MIKKQLLYCLIFFYIAVVIVGTGLYFSLNKVAIHSVEKEITKNYQAMLDNLVTDIGYIIKDTREVVLGIEEKITIRELLYLDKEVTDQDNYKFVKAIKELQDIKIYNSAIDEMYVYYNRHKKILNKRGTYYPKVAYEIFHRNQEEGYSAWLEALEGNYDKGKILIIGKRLVYVQTISNYKKENRANIFIVFDEERLTTLLQESRIAKYGHIAILDKQNELLVSTLSEEENKLLQDIEDNKKYTLVVTENKVEGLKYVGIIHNKVFSQKASYINKVFFVVTNLFIMVILIGIRMIYKKYGYVNRLLSKIRKVVKANEKGAYGEFEYIEQAVEGMSKRLKSDRSKVVENIFRKAVYGTQLDEKVITKYLGEKATRAQFVVGGIVLESEENKPKSKGNNFMIQNIFEEVLGDGYSLYTLDYSEGYMLIINFESTACENRYEDIIGRLNVGRNFFEENFDLRYILVLSDVHEGISSLGDACEEVEKTLEYSVFFSQEKTAIYSQIIRENDGYIYSMEDQICLVKSIKEGISNKAIGSLKEIFKANFCEKNRSLENSKKLIRDIALTLEQIGSEMGFEQIELMKELECEKTLGDIEIEFEKAIESLCQKVQVNKKRKVDNKIQNIMNYIEEHFCEQELTVTALAENFGIQVSYISKFFKENTGQNLLQYITRKRIEEAKRLLLETNDNLNEIAEQVGLLNNIALIRSFKKYEYVTPNEYRNTKK